MSEYIDFALHGVADAGQPNLERIVLKATAPTMLNQYGISVGLQLEDGPRPYLDQCFWFPDNTLIEAGDWVFVYTGPGEPTRTQLTHPFSGTLHTFHWGRSKTVFFHPSVVPILFRILDILAPPAPAFPVPQSQAAQLPATARTALASE